MKKLFITLMMLAGMVSAAWAQVDDVSLVVSGEGPTKDEAITKALRSAIEQAFGVFVSANTEILNDELVRDEIATVSSGNVKKYTELGTINKPNGNVEVSLHATVSVKNLTSYAKSHGSSAEFAGATFAQNLKLIELNRENTKKAIINLNRQLASIGGCTMITDENIRQNALTGPKASSIKIKYKDLEDIFLLCYDDFFDVKIDIGTPKVNGDLEVTMKYYPTGKAQMIADLIKSTIVSLSIPEDHLKNLKSQDVIVYGYTILDKCYGKTDTKLAYRESKHETQSGLTNIGVRGFFGGRILYFYAPIVIPPIAGTNYFLYDNLNNEYRLYDKYSDEYDYLVTRNYFMSGIRIPEKNTGVDGGHIGLSGVGYLDIPGCYNIPDDNQNAKGKSEELFELKGTINLPMDKISQITNIIAKQAKIVE